MSNKDKTTQPVQELPPLPLHIYMLDLNVRGGSPQPVYSAKQMREYADAALRSQGQAVDAKHEYFYAGQPDCPADVKAPNGELHTLRCRRCGQDNPRGTCAPAGRIK